MGCAVPLARLRVPRESGVVAGDQGETFPALP